MAGSKATAEAAYPVIGKGLGLAGEALLPSYLIVTLDHSPVPGSGWGQVARVSTAAVNHCAGLCSAQAS